MNEVVNKAPILIVGAGPVGLALAIFLKKAGYDDVIVLEKKSRNHLINASDDRSVNITLSFRGMQVLETLNLTDQLGTQSAKVSGRCYHKNNETSFVPYTLIGDKKLTSVKRKDLLNVLIVEAQQWNIELLFEHNLIEINSFKNQCVFLAKDAEIKIDYSFLFGTDGINSKVRNLMRLEADVQEHEFVYKKIDVTTENVKQLDLRLDAVNVINTQTDAILITLPNTDGAPSGLLHMNRSIVDEVLSARTDLKNLFPEFVNGIDNFSQQFVTNRTGSFNSLDCREWSHLNALLLGDAAHAILPFYGQGTNIGLEDVLIFMYLLNEKHYNIQEAIESFQLIRKASTDAISKLSYLNLNNLSLTIDTGRYMTLRFLELLIEQHFPGYHPEYFRVAFTHERFEKILSNSFILEKALLEIVDKHGLRGTQFSIKILKEAHSQIARYFRVSS